MPSSTLTRKRTQRADDVDEIPEDDEDLDLDDLDDDADDDSEDVEDSEDDDYDGSGAEEEGEDDAVAQEDDDPAPELRDYYLDVSLEENGDGTKRKPLQHRRRSQGGQARPRRDPVRAQPHYRRGP